MSVPRAVLSPLTRPPFRALAAFDVILGAALLLLPAVYFTTVSYAGARQIAPIPVWGALLLALGAAIWWAPPRLRQYVTAIGGMLLPAMFALTFLVTCITTSWQHYAAGSPGPPSSPVSAVLWAALTWMHYRAGVLYGPRWLGARGKVDDR